MNAPAPKKPSEVRAWCEANGFHPNKTLGQNFLIDGNVSSAIAADASLGPSDSVLEIGPGLGALTDAILATGAKVTAVEKDEVLFKLLSSTRTSDPGLTLMCGDALEIVNDDFLAANGFTALVSNLPYSVGTRILLDVCRSRFAPASCTVMVQKEVADRFAAAPGSPARGQAGVWVQRRYDVKVTRIVPPTCFWPRPEVSSAVVRLTAHGRLALADGEARTFERITKLAFSHRRKQMASIFKAPEWIEGVGLDPRVRPEEITNEQWCELARTCKLEGLAN